jgi:hypothetical protein
MSWSSDQHPFNSGVPGLSLFGNDGFNAKAPRRHSAANCRLLPTRGDEGCSDRGALQKFG